MHSMFQNGDNMISCAFIGHRTVLSSTASQLEEALDKLIQGNDSVCCYVGDTGEFDTLCAATIHSFKKKYPSKTIQLVLVLPYMQKKINANKIYYETYFDEILIPAELVGIHYKRAISMRNQWMIDHADCLIAMIWRDFGGAYQAVEYAKKRKKHIIYLTNTLPIF